MTVDGIVNYLKETGLFEKMDNLEPGKGFGVEIPVDDNGKFLHFWLSMTTENEERYAIIDFDKVLSIRVCCDEKRLEDWVLNSGIIELSEMSGTEQEEVKVTQ